jgi:hypothetical protein
MATFHPYAAANPNPTPSPQASEDPWFEGQSNGTPQSIPYGGYNSSIPPQPPQAYGLSSSSGAGANMNYGAPTGPQTDEDYDNEPPLLEELGIRFDHIWTKTQAVVNPISKLRDDILEDADLAGPIFFALILGSCLLLAGKVHFGYIYGFSMFGCLGMHMIVNLLHQRGLDFVMTCSVLGYGLLPVIALAGVSIVFNLQGVAGMALAAGAIAWSTFAAGRLFDKKLVLTEQYWLVAYPVVLLYSCFVLITIF